MEGLGELNLALLDLGMSGEQAGQIDQIVSDVTALGQQGGFGTITQKKRSGEINYLRLLLSKDWEMPWLRVEHLVDWCLISARVLRRPSHNLKHLKK
jgi:hypothetical protein